MNARLSESTVEVARPRVLSVSPMTAAPMSADVHSAGGTIFVSPPESSGSHVSDLIPQARDVAAKLARAVNNASATEAQANRASQCLQDRLRVGARMLQAFQAQISRIESCIASCEEVAINQDLDNQVAAIEQRLEIALDVLDRRLAAIERSQ